MLSESNNKAVSDDLINSRLENVAVSLKEEMNIKDVNINYGKNSNVNRITYNNEENIVPTPKLYNISKLIIKEMSGK